MATARLPQFERDILRARDLVGLGQSYAAITHGVVDSADIYRASLVQAVAALDHYFHGVVLDLGAAVLLGRKFPGKGSNFGIAFQAVQEILSAEEEYEREQLARMHVAQRLSYESFQKAESIGKALAAVGIPKAWATAFPPPLISPAKELDLIVARRNKIAHQGDSDPLLMGDPTPILPEDALEAVRTIERIVRTFDSLCEAHP